MGDAGWRRPGEFPFCIDDTDVPVRVSEHSSDASAGPEVEPVFMSALAPEPILRIRARVSGHSAEVITDSGSSRKLIAEHLVAGSVQTDGETPRIRAIGGRVVEPLGTAEAVPHLHRVLLELTDCLILNGAASPADVILGRATLKRLGLGVDVASRSVSGYRPDHSRWTVYLPPTISILSVWSLSLTSNVEHQKMWMLNQDALWLSRIR